MDFGQARNTTAWHPEPKFRGTYGLLSSCIVTMGLCVWTAVHLNIPELEREGTKRYLFPRQTWRKVKWLLIGLFAPELVAWTALVQWQETKEFHRQMKALLGEDQASKRNWPAKRGSKNQMNWQAIPNEGQRLEEACKPKTQDDTSDNKRRRRRNTWTMTHSYYATMGGFAFSNQSPGGEFATPDGWKRVTLTSLGILELVRSKPELLPDLSVEDIQDKSKANGLAKVIVIMQASWFMIQCLSRLITGMTISVLELNTFAHALCALVAYAMWWHKPFDISQPTLVEGNGSHDLCASLYMYQVNPGHHDLYNGCFGVEVGAFNESEKNLRTGMILATEAPMHVEGPNTNEWVIKLSSNDDEPLSVKVSAPSGFYKSLQYPRHNGQRSSSEMLLPGIVSQSNGDAIFRLYYKQTIFGMRIHPKGAFPSDMAYRFRWIMGHGRTDIFVELSPAQLLFCQLLFCQLDSNPSLKCHTTNRVANSFNGDGTCIDFTRSMIVGLVIGGLNYGGIHLLAWNPPVQSNIEITIWRLSAMFIMVFGCGAWAIWMLHRTWKKFKRGKEYVKWVGHTITLLRSKFMENMAVTVVIGTTIIYTLARIYLVVECFVSLPRLPDSVFQTPAWAQYFPHFG